MERNELNHRIRLVLIALTLIVYIMAGAASISGITIYLALLCVASIIGVMDMTAYQSGHRLAYESKMYNTCLLMLALVLLSFVLNFISFSFSINRLVLIVCCMSFTFLCGNVLNNTEKIVKVCWLVIIPVTISALVVIGQGLNISAAYQFSKLLGGGSESEVLSLSLESERYYGLAKSALYFGYQASAAVALLMFMPQRKQTTCNKILRFSALLILIISLLFNRTRSAQLSVALILFVKLIHSGRMKFTRQGLVRMAVIVCIAILLGVFAVKQIDNDGLISAFRLNELDHAGTTARIPMLLTALNYGIHHPFGMGVYKASSEYVVGLTSGRELAYVLNNACHNLLANCVGNHGLFTAFLMILIYVLSFKECSTLRKNTDGELQEITIGAELVISTLLLNGAMHNLYILSGDLLTWFAFGLVIAVRRIIMRNN